MADAVLRPHHPDGKASYGQLQNEDGAGYGKCHGHASCHNHSHTFKVAASERLRRHTTCAHAKKSAEPIDDVENHAAHCHGSYIYGIAHVSGYCHVHNAKKRYRHIRDNGRYRYAQYFTVCIVHKLFTLKARSPHRIRRGRTSAKPQRWGRWP